MATKKKLLEAAAGAAGGEALNVESVFSTYLYDGNEGIQTITNDINLGQSFSGTGSDGSALFGGNGDYVSVSGLSSSITGDFTIELFGYNTSPVSETHVLLGPWGDGTHGNQILLRFVGESLGVVFPSFEVNLAKSIHGIGRNEWFHLAITRDSGTLRIFANGAKVHSSSYSTTINLGTLYIGSEKQPFTQNGNWEGNISNVRVSDTTAFYTADFTLPTANLTNISNTDLLTLQGSTPFVDNSSNSLTVTDGGSVSAASGGPFPVADGEGGMVWVNSRTNASYDQYISDTERGVLKYLKPNGTSQEGSSSNAISAFNGKGFTIGGGGQLNNGTDEYASWTFRKAPKFFTCLTYSGTGTAQNISHDLDATVGTLIVKRTDSSDNWTVWHRGVNSGSGSSFLNLNLTSGYSNSATRWNSTAPTSTQFSVGTHASVNASGGTYVAYLFAHNDDDGEFGPDNDADIIKCGSYTGNGSSDGPEIDLGFEPQWLLTKRATNGDGNWRIVDNMRGVPTGGNTSRLWPNLNSAEDSGAASTNFTATGFKLTDNVAEINNNGSTYIYIAIRRGPMAVPEDADDVFDVETYTGNNSTNRSFTSGTGVVDLAFRMRRDTGGGNSSWICPRLTERVMRPNLTNAEEPAGDADINFDTMDGYYVSSTAAANFGWNVSSSTQVNWLWKRAPNYFDVVAYTGNGTAGRTVSHNLGVAPEMMWVKRRNATQDWKVYHTGLTSASYELNLNQTSAESATSVWAGTDPTDAVFSVGSNQSVNNSGDTYIAYLFASLDGVSKVGSYTGTGSTQTIDCGFSSGARFVLIKCTNDAENWIVFDSERGIVSGNDPYLALNTTDAEVTNQDLIDPVSSGFAVNTNFGEVNNSSNTYIFYAIA